MTDEYEIVPARGRADLAPETRITPALENRSGASTDEALVDLWVSTKRSPGTQRNYRRVGRKFLEFLQILGVEGLQTCTVADLQAWAGTLTGCAGTKGNYIGAVKSLFSFAHTTGYVQFNVAVMLARPVVPNDLAQRLMSVEVTQQLFDAATPRTEALLRFLYYSAARISEACDMRWKHIRRADDGGAEVTLHGKGGKTRHVRLEPEQAVYLWELGDGGNGPSTNLEAFVFATSRGNRLNPRGAAALLKTAAVRAGLAEWVPGRRGKTTGLQVSPHWFRHAHASHALDAGAPPHLVQATLGHASLNTTSRYIHARPGESSGRFLNELHEKHETKETE